jgi:SAM-dependent methyltransferase
MRRAVEIDPGASLRIGGGGSGGSDASRRRLQLWQRHAVPAFESAIREYYAGQGAQADSPEVRSTIATNTELVPARVDAICRYLRDLQGVGSLRGARVLDLGAGFGAFATYLALDPAQPLVTSIEIRPDFVATSREVAARIGLDNLDARVGDMRSLSTIADGQFDVVILNNSFLYLPSEADMDQAIAEIARVMRTGARVAFFHANRWRLTEPFTGAPLLHLLPPRAADAVSMVTGWRHNHGRVRLVSAPWLSRQLRRHGLTDTRSSAQGGVGILPRAWLSRYYAVTARKPSPAGR